MSGGARPPNRSLLVSPVDRLGRTISPLVLDAAEQIGRRAIEHAEKLLIDPAVAAGLLEEAAVNRLRRCRPGAASSTEQRLEVHRVLARTSARPLAGKEEIITQH